MYTEREMASNGEFLRVYGKSYFAVVSEALDICKVRWEMVPIGKAGKEGIVFFLSTEQMLKLCMEIKTKEFHKKIAAGDKAAFPSVYKYTTGDDGHLTLAIGNGNIGSKLSIQDSKNNKRALMGVDISSFEEMATKYLLATGLIPVVNNSYYANIIKTFENGRIERAKERKASRRDRQPNSNNSNNNSYNNSNDNSKNNKKGENKNNKKNESKEEGNIKRYSLELREQTRQNKSFYFFEGIDKETKENITLMFRKEVADTLSWFQSFINQISIKATSIEILGEQRESYVLFKGLANS